uniref:Down syndrome cell adhesion molecule-like protein Dscam2 n=1 Tax=Cacopsylla melanoneura TaxID=428564 RepID=A0A8D9ADR7_9HEMI
MEVQVMVLPRISPFHFDTPLFAGQTAQVACTVNEGDLPLNFFWTFNENRNLPSGITINKMGTKMSVLLIDSVQSEHSGVYSCSVQNQAATVNYTASLQVNGTTHLHVCPPLFVYPYHLFLPFVILVFSTPSFYNHLFLG